MSEHTREPATRPDTLTPGRCYDVTGLQLLGWTWGLGVQPPELDGYNIHDYLPGGRYLGPDRYGVEPIFDPASIRELDKAEA